MSWTSFAAFHCASVMGLKTQPHSKHRRGFLGFLGVMGRSRVRREYQVGEERIPRHGSSKNRGLSVDRASPDPAWVGNSAASCRRRAAPGRLFSLAASDRRSPQLGGSGENRTAIEFTRARVQVPPSPDRWDYAKVNPWIPGDGSLRANAMRGTGSRSGCSGCGGRGFVLVIAKSILFDPCTDCAGTGNPCVDISKRAS